MTTRITNVFVPEVHSRAVSQVADNQNRLVAMGAATPDAMLNELLAGPGTGFKIPVFSAVDADAWNVSSDDPATDATPVTLSEKEQLVPRLARNQWYSEMDLARTLSGESVLENLVNQLGESVNANRQRALLAMIKGILASTDFADLIHAGGANDFSISMFASAIAEIFVGRYDGNEILCVNPTTFAMMQTEMGAAKVTIPVGDLNVSINTYATHPVIVDKGVPASTTYVVKPGAIGFGSGGVATKTKVSELAGNGSGQSYVGVLEDVSFSVLGADYTASAYADSDLETGTNWDLIASVTDVTKCGIGKITHN